LGSLMKSEAAPLLPAPSHPCRCASREANLVVMVAVVILTGIAKMFTDHALSVQQTQIAHDTGVPSVVSALPCVGSAFYVLGKLVGVPFSSSIGAYRGLVAAMFVSTVASLTFTIGTPAAMYISWCTYRFATAFVWPCGVRTFVAWFDTCLFGRASAILAIAWEGGAILAGLGYSFMVQKGYDWRNCFHVATVISGTTLAIIAAFLHDNPASLGLRAPVIESPELSEHHPLSDVSGPVAARALLTDWVLWLGLLGMSCASACAYLGSYASVFVTEALGGSPSAGAYTSSMSAIGAIVGVVFGGIVYDYFLPTRSMRSRFMAVWSGLYSFVMGFILLYLVGVKSVAWYCVVLLGAGFFASVPYGIMQVVFACKYASARHVGSFIHLLDAFALSVSVLAQMIAGDHMVYRQFNAYVVTTAIFSSFAGIFLVLFLVFDLRFRSLEVPIKPLLSP